MDRRTWPLVTIVLFLAFWVAAGQSSEPELLSAKVQTPPVVDGKDNDSVWQQAKSLDLTLRDVPGSPRGRTVPATIKSVHTDNHIYFLVQWRDATKNVFHKMWVWNPQAGGYEQSKDIEDDCALAFPIRGEFTADMLGGAEAVWDVWHWKASRTDPAGHAQDRRHIYAFQRLRPQAVEYKARNGKTIYIDRPEDTGRSVTMSQSKPVTFVATSVYQYSAQLPDGSAADIRAKGEWSDGQWTVEMERRLTTGYDDDVQFDLTQNYSMGVAAHDSEEHQNHSVSGVIRLRFAKP